jgi:eukaryotic-like serine/threonine-protein kinase
MPFQPGARLGPYEFVGMLGEGGMGQVYRARDTKLNRDVAIKVLPELFALDPDRLARFTREAQTLASLNHSNIAAVYGLESESLVMELVEGEDLSAIIARGPLPLAEALPIARQIADALEAAHEQGIVHRDLKPANIKVRPDGTVKVLDFGLAKALGPVGGGSSVDAMHSPTLTARATQMGVILGTAAYMAPEQARGKAVDKRGDIWAFGVVVLEMLTGRRAFDGDEMSDVLAAVLRQDIDWSGLPRETPLRLRRLLERCLERDVRQRLRDIGEARVEIGRIERGDPDSSPSAAAAVSPPPRARRASPILAVGALAAGAAVMFVADRAMRSSAITPFGPPIGVFAQVTDLPGVERTPSLSPDGKSVVYSKTVDGDTDLYLQRIGSRTAVKLTPGSPLADWQPSFSPDGERIAFRSERDGGGVFLMTPSGESVTRLTDVGYSPAWSPDGRQIVVATDVYGLPHDVSGSGTGMIVVNVATGEKTISSPLYVLQPNWSPHGQRIACWTLHAGGRRDIVTLAADGSDAAAGGVPVTNDAAIDWSPVWSPDGRAIYFSSLRGGTMNLWRVAVDERTGKVLGEPEPVTTPSTYAGELSFSRDGTRLAYASIDYRSTLFRVPFDGAREAVTGAPVPIVKGTRAIRDHELSPDGQWVVFNEEGAQEDLYVARIDGTEYRRLTDEPGRHRGPRWSPDGARIAFYSDRDGSYELWTIRPDGSGLTQVTTGANNASFPVWSPDGKRIAFGLTNWFLADAAATKMAPPATGEVTYDLKNGTHYPASWSLTGDRIVGLVQAPTGATSTVATYSLQARRFTTVPGSLARSGLWLWPAWLPDGKRLLVRTDAGLTIVDASTGAGHALMPVPGYNIGASAGVSRDGRWITYTETATDGDIWVATIKK